MTYEDYSVMGIDLSSDSDVLRWDSVWKVSIQFVMLRASIGMEEDPKFDEWMREMDNGCVRVGAYHAIRAHKVTDVRNGFGNTITGSTSLSAFGSIRKYGSMIQNKSVRM